MIDQSFSFLQDVVLLPSVYSRLKLKVFVHGELDLINYNEGYHTYYRVLLPNGTSIGSTFG